MAQKLPMVPPVYDDNYMKKRHNLAWRGPQIAQAINQLVCPYKIIDLGCSIGDIVNGFRLLGKDALGVDSSRAAFRNRVCVEHAFLLQDITEPLYLWPSYRGCPEAYYGMDLVTCWEVMSVLVDSARFEVAKNILRLYPKWVFLGMHDSRENIPAYNLIRSKYFTNHELTRKFKEALASDSRKLAIKAIYNSTVVFEKGE